jgi:deoxyxylulose-5-phosphate synthase
MHALNKMASADELNQQQRQEENTAPSYSKIFGNWLCEMAPTEPK